VDLIAVELVAAELVAVRSGIQLPLQVDDHETVNGKSVRTLRRILLEAQIASDEVVCKSGAVKSGAP
jgi:hypothetical protein